MYVYPSVSFLADALLGSALLRKVSSTKLPANIVVPFNICVADEGRTTIFAGATPALKL